MPRVSVDVNDALRCEPKTHMLQMAVWSTHIEKCLFSRARILAEHHKGTLDVRISASDCDLFLHLLFARVGCRRCKAHARGKVGLRRASTSNRYRLRQRLRRMRTFCILS